MWPCSKWDFVWERVTWCRQHPFLLEKMHEQCDVFSWAKQIDHYVVATFPCCRQLLFLLEMREQCDVFSWAMRIDYFVVATFLCCWRKGDRGCEWDRAGDLDHGRTMLSFRGVGDLR